MDGKTPRFWAWATEWKEDRVGGKVVGVVLKSYKAIWFKDLFQRIGKKRENTS